MYRLFCDDYFVFRLKGSPEKGLATIDWRREQGLPESPDNRVRLSPFCAQLTEQQARRFSPECFDDSADIHIRNVWPVVRQSAYEPIVANVQQGTILEVEPQMFEGLWALPLDNLREVTKIEQVHQLTELMHYVITSQALAEERTDAELREAKTAFLEARTARQQEDNDSLRVQLRELREVADDAQEETRALEERCQSYLAVMGHFCIVSPRVMHAAACEQGGLSTADIWATIEGLREEVERLRAKVAKAAEKV